MFGINHPNHYSADDQRAVYARALVQAFKATDPQRKAEAVVQAAGASKLVDRGSAGTLDSDLATVARIQKAMDLLAADRKNPAKKRLAQLDKEYSEFLLNRLASAIKSINGGAVKSLERAVIACEELLRGQPATAGISDHLAKVANKSKDIKRRHVEAVEDDRRVDHAHLVLGRAESDKFANCIVQTLKGK